MRLLVLCVFAFAVSLAAQSSVAPSDAIQITPQEAYSHRIGHDKPIYPRFALAAGISGSVNVTITVGADGFIYTATPATRTPALLTAAQLWIAGVKFRPFLHDGQPVSVTTTLSVMFTLPPGAHSAHPLAALYQRNITSTIEREGPDSPPRARWSTISPAMRDWLARYQASVSYYDSEIASSSFDDVLAAHHDAAPLNQTPGNIALYPLQLAVPKHRFFLLFEFSHGCAKSNCPIFLLDETPAGVSIAVSARGSEVDLHRRRDSPYPDVLFWSHPSTPGQTGVSNIAGFSYYAGQWGQLYCGIDDANEDFERDEAIADRHGARIIQPPLVTLCK
jgi:hypothetical protein